MSSGKVFSLAAFIASCLCLLLVPTATASPVPGLVVRDDINSTDGMPSNLPPPTYNGSFVGHANAVIDAPIEDVWNALLDFPKYPEWNSFVRSQVITDKDKKPLEDQTPGVGKYMVMKVHIPPTMDDKVLATEVFEQITAIEPDTHRAAWVSTIPRWFLRAERWQALSTTEDGKTLYESREIFAGPGAYAVKLFIGGNLQKSFQAQADNLKSYVEGLKGN